MTPTQSPGDGRLGWGAKRGLRQLVAVPATPAAASHPQPQPVLSACPRGSPGLKWAGSGRRRCRTPRRHRRLAGGRAPTRAARCPRGVAAAAAWTPRRSAGSWPPRSWAAAGRPAGLRAARAPRRRRGLRARHRPGPGPRRHCPAASPGSRRPPRRAGARASRRRRRAAPRPPAAPAAPARAAPARAGTGVGWGRWCAAGSSRWRRAPEGWAARRACERTSPRCRGRRAAAACSSARPWRWPRRSSAPAPRTPAPRSPRRPARAPPAPAAAAAAWAAAPAPPTGPRLWPRVPTWPAQTVADGRAGAWAPSVRALRSGPAAAAARAASACGRRSPRSATLRRKEEPDAGEAAGGGRPSLWPWPRAPGRPGQARGVQSRPRGRRQPARASWSRPAAPFQAPCHPSGLEGLTLRAGSGAPILINSAVALCPPHGRGL